MKKTFILMLSVSLLIVASCKKSISNNDEGAQTNCQVSESIFTSSGDSGRGIYTYNSDGRVTKVFYVGEDYEMNYTYTSAQILESVKAGNTTTTNTYTLNSQGRIASENNVTYNYKIDYVYNSEGYLIESIRTENNNSVSTKYTYTNGDLTKVAEPGFIQNISYGNLEAKGNYFDFTDGGIGTHFNSVLRRYFGKMSKHEITKIAHEGSTYVYEFTYETDAKGNVVKLTGKDNTGGQQYTFENKFSCK